MGAEIEDKAESRSRGGLWLLWLAGALVLYALSIGPMALLSDKGYFGRGPTRVLEVVYSPLAWASRNAVLGKPLDAYLRLWLPIRHGSFRAPITAAMTQIGNFKTALDAFHADNGFYPTGTNGLKDLVRQPAETTNWHGPYLESIPKDPWGHDYIYECPGKHTASGYPYDLLSPGTPRENHPIENWVQPKTKP